MAQITIADDDATVQYTVGSTPTTGPWSIPFPYFSTADIKVYFDGVLQTITTHYTISGTAVDDGFSAGSVTAVSNQNDITITIDRDVTIERTTDHPAAGIFSIATLNTTLDKIFAIMQFLETRFRNSLSRPTTSTETYSLDWPDGATAIEQFVTVTTAGLGVSASTGAQWKGGDGTVSLPYYTFSADLDSGLYRIGANNVGLTVAGAKVLDVGTGGLGITGTLTTSGIISQDDTTDSTSGTTGSIHTDGGLGVAKKLHVIGVATFGDDVVSDTDSTDDLGTTGVRWANLWADAATLTDNLTVGGNATITGDLTVNGTTTTVNTTNTVISDLLIELANGATGSAANDAGIIIERGDDANIFAGWDESADEYVLATTTSVGSVSGNVVISAYAGLHVAAITASAGTLAGLTSLAMSAGATLTAGFLDEDDMSTDSAVAGVTQQSVKAYVDSSSKAAGISMTWETTTTDTDQGVGKVWANNSTLSSATVLYFDDVERNSVSINALVDSLDDPSATTSAFIYIQEAGSATAGVVFKVTGAVTSASTYSKVAVTHVATFGTLADGDVVGVLFSFSGDDGAGSGTVTMTAGSSTDNVWPRFDGTDGINLQDGDWAEDDSGNVVAGGTLGMVDQELGRALLKDTAETTVAKGNFGATPAFDLSAGNVQWGTADQAVTSSTMTNWAPTGTTGYLALEIINGGARAFVWPTSVDWVGGVAPTMTAAGVDQFVFRSRDAGTTVLGFVVGLDVKSPA